MPFSLVVYDISDFNLRPSRKRYENRYRAGANSCTITGTLEGILVSGLRLFFFGSPQCERDGLYLEMDTRKASALLAYLAVSGVPQQRDVLAAFLWPELDQMRARGALRRTLSTLKSAIGPAWLEASREEVRLVAAPGLWVDVWQFRRLLAESRAHRHPPGEACQGCLPQLEQAVSLYRGDFLAGFSLRDSVNFDDWQFLQSEQLRREFSAALEQLVTGHTLLGELGVAIEYAHRWLALDTLHEPAHRMLMKLYGWTDRRDVALRQYRECARILETELGVSPLEETVALYEMLKVNRLPPPPRLIVEVSPAAPPLRASPALPQTPTRPETLPPSRTALPLVGRAEEWRALVGAYDQLAGGGVSAKKIGRFIVIEGEPGIGKTRLAEDFLADLRKRGASTILARCYPGETTLSYGVFTEVLRAAVSQPAHTGWLKQLPRRCLAEAARLAPELADFDPALPAVGALESPGAQAQFFEAIAQFLLAAFGGPAPGCLCLDDLQWVDAASLDLLAYLVQRLRNHPLCILGTWCSDEVEANHRLRQVLAAALRAGTASRISLPRLHQPDIQELVRYAAGGQLAPEIEERLFVETEGLPFFLVEFLNEVVRQGLERPEADWSGLGSVRELLLSRLSSISETGWQLLTTASVIGRSFGFNILREASGRSEEEAVSGLESLLARGLIRETKAQGEETDLFYDFNHEKLRALVYAETTLARRRLLHRRVAEALANRAHTRRMLGLLAGQIAHHYQQAGMAPEAANFYQQAGEYARTLFANHDALNHFQTALALGHPDIAGLSEVCGDLCTLLGEYNAALASYERAAAERSAHQLAILERKIGGIYQRRGDWALAQGHYQAALGALAGEERHHQRAIIYAEWSLSAHRAGQAAQADDLAQQSLALAEQAEDDQALTQAHNILGVLARSQSNLPQARLHLEKSLALAEKIGEPGARVAALNNLALVCSQEGETGRAIQLLETALELCISQGDRHRAAALHSNLADLFYACGQLQASRLHLTQSVSIYAEIGGQAGEWQPEIWKLVEW
jgi:predicted ATPase/DNA-binding SARP family transcriptional activator